MTVDTATQGPTAETVEQDQPQYEWLLQCEVIDVHGEEIGTVDTAWLDMATGKVEFIGVRPHWLTLEVLSIPVVHGDLRDDTRVIRLPYVLDIVKQAPRHKSHGTLTDEGKAAIYEHFRSSP
jgi:sporulation protein YlmC with PRC-barrel domain